MAKKVKVVVKRTLTVTEAQQPPDHKVKVPTIKRIRWSIK